MNLLVWLFLVLYLLLVFYSLRNKMSINNVETYLFDGGSASSLDILGSNIGTSVGAGVVFSLIAVGYEAGFVGIYIGLSYAVGFLLLGLFSRRIRLASRKCNAATFTGILSENLSLGPGHKKIFVSSVTIVNLIAFFFLLAAQFVALALTINLLLPVGKELGLVISAVAIILYTAFSGLPGVYITDRLQLLFLFIFVFVILLPFVFKGSSAFDGIGSLPPEFFSGLGYGGTFLVGLVFLMPSALGRADFWQRIVSAKCDRSASRAFFLTAPTMLIFYIALPLVGIGIRLIMGGGIDPSDAAFSLIGTIGSQWLLAFCVVGLVSAIMSSADSFLLMLSFLIVRDINFFGSNRLWDEYSAGGRDSECKIMKRIRFASLGVGVFCVLIALVVPDIVDLMVAATSAVVVFVPLILHALLGFSFVGPTVAVLSVLFGAIANFLLFFMGVFGVINFEPKASFVVGFVVSLLVCLSGAIISKLAKSVVPESNGL